MAINPATDTVFNSLDQVFVKSFREFRNSAKTFSERAVKVVRLALNRAIDNKSFAEWQYIQEQLAAKQVKGAPARKDILSATAKAALRKAIRTGIALVAGEAVDGADRPTFKIHESKLNAEIQDLVDGRLQYWRTRRNAFTSLDAIAVRIEKEAPDTEALIKRFAAATSACLAAGLTLQDLIETLKDLDTEAPKTTA